ncbi:MAG: hypothetical protein LBT92_01545 [Rickettsiales bacterium]|jgi:uncharacterized protein YcbK (DUF882 family)|nr:hypothetical protein [Rickettsiales bacterium]
MQFELSELYKGYAELDVPERVLANLKDLQWRLNRLSEHYLPAVIVNRGYRDPEYNAKVGGQKTSPHLAGQAVDLSDRAGVLKAWCVANLDKLRECGLFMEDPAATPTWCHLQSRPASRTIFKP